MDPIDILTCVASVLCICDFAYHLVAAIARKLRAKKDRP